MQCAVALGTTSSGQVPVSTHKLHFAAAVCCPRARGRKGKESLSECSCVGGTVASITERHLSRCGCAGRLRIWMRLEGRPPGMRSCGLGGGVDVGECGTPTGAICVQSGRNAGTSIGPPEVHRWFYCLRRQMYSQA